MAGKTPVPVTIHVIVNHVSRLPVLTNAVGSAISMPCALAYQYHAKNVIPNTSIIRHASLISLYVSFWMLLMRALLLLAIVSFFIMYIVCINSLFTKIYTNKKHSNAMFLQIDIVIPSARDARTDVLYRHLCICLYSEIYSWPQSNIPPPL